MAIDAHIVKSVRSTFNYVKHFAYEAKKKWIIIFCRFWKHVWQYERPGNDTVWILYIRRIETKKNGIDEDDDDDLENNIYDTIIANRRKQTMKMIESKV